MAGRTTWRGALPGGAHYLAGRTTCGAHYLAGRTTWRGALPGGAHYLAGRTTYGGAHYMAGALHGGAHYGWVNRILSTSWVVEQPSTSPTTRTSPP